MLKMKRITETYEMKVFTDTGEYFGDVEESILTKNTRASTSATSRRAS
jgi:sporulation protein YlmC with PRC-barrel domain